MSECAVTIHDEKNELALAAWQTSSPLSGNREISQAGPLTRQGFQAYWR